MLISELTKNSTYDLIILDMSESVQGIYRILERCDRIYMPVSEDRISQSKLKQYDENVKQLKLEKLERITCRFVMPEQVEEYAKVRAKEEMI